MSQDLHANHESKQPRSRQGDLPACLYAFVCTGSRLASSRLVSLLPPPSAPLLRHAPALQWLTIFFLREGFQKIAGWLLALSLMLTASSVSVTGCARDGRRSAAQPRLGLSCESLSARLCLAGSHYWLLLLAGSRWALLVASRSLPGRREVLYPTRTRSSAACVRKV